jgi:ribonuclease BN (tRNA processing enzyme)
MQDRAEKSMHSTSNMVGQFASKVAPKHLIITHFSMRYTGLGVKPDVSDLLHETQLACPGITVSAANDMSSFDVEPHHKKKQEPKNRDKKET